MEEIVQQVWISFFVANLAAENRADIERAKDALIRAGHEEEFVDALIGRAYLRVLDLYELTDTAKA